MACSKTLEVNMPSLKKTNQSEEAKTLQKMDVTKKHQHVYLPSPATAGVIASSSLALDAGPRSMDPRLALPLPSLLRPQTVGQSSSDVLTMEKPEG